MVVTREVVVVVVVVGVSPQKPGFEVVIVGSQGELFAQTTFYSESRDRFQAVATEATGLLKMGLCARRVVRRAARGRSGKSVKKTHRD